jgi:hypothetical protein
LLRVGSGRRPLRTRFYPPITPDAPAATSQHTGVTENRIKPLPLAHMARRLRVPPKWLRAEAEAGRIPHLKAGAVLLFDADAVDRIIRERLRKAEQQVAVNDEVAP